MAKAKAKAKTTPKKTVTKKVEEPKVEEPKVEEKVVEEPKVEEKEPEPVVKEVEVTEILYHRNAEGLVDLINSFVKDNIKEGNLIDVKKSYNPDREQRQAVITYKK